MELQARRWAGIFIRMNEQTATSSNTLSFSSYILTSQPALGKVTICLPHHCKFVQVTYHIYYFIHLLSTITTSV